MNPEVVTISSIQQLIEEAANIYFKGAKIRKYIVSKDLNITIAIKGKSWSKLIDYRTAQFVTRIQEEVFHAYWEATQQTVNFKSSQDKIKPLVVKVEISKGSQLAGINVDRIIQEILNKVDSEHTFWLAVVSIAALLGYWSLKKILDHKAIIAKMAKDNEQMKMVTEITNNALYAMRAAQNSMDGLIRHMDNEDVIEFPEEERKLTKEEAKKSLPPLVEKTPIERSLYVDDTFEVTIINFEKQLIRLRRGNISFDAVSISMSDDDKVKLNRVGEKSLKEKKVQTLDLQLSIKFKDGNIYLCSITGIGSKRSNAITLDKAMALTKPQEAN